MIVNCDFCGKLTKTKKSKLKKFSHTFCSQKCFGDWQRQNSPKSVKQCLVCGKEFSIIPSKTENKMTCSRECSSQLRFKIEERPCENCGKSVCRRPSEFRKFKHVYCSQECCNEWRKDRPRPDHGPKVQKTLKGRIPSPQCIQAVSKSSAMRLRDPAVQAKMQAGLREYYAENPGPWKDAYGEANPNWKGGIAYEPYSHLFNERLKEAIRDRDQRTCQLCGMSEDEYKKRFQGYRLTIHHIDYDKKNSDSSNLIALCAACNSKANGNRKYYQQLFSSYIVNIQRCLDQMYPVE